MSDDLSQKIAQISELLNQEGMADNIKGIIGMLSNSVDSQDTPAKEQNNSKGKDERKPNYNYNNQNQNTRELEQNMEMMRQVQRVMEVMRSTNNDPRMNLLNAIRPYLSNSKQKKISNAMRILQMTSLTKLMDKDGKNFFNF